MPSAVFTDPQIATVGLTENRSPRTPDSTSSIKVQDYGDIAYGWAMEDTTGIAKLIADAAPGDCSARTSWATRRRRSSSR